MGMLDTTMLVGPNYAIKGTSVEALDSSESSSGASVPYLGCYTQEFF